MEILVMIELPEGSMPPSQVEQETAVRLLRFAMGRDARIVGLVLRAPAIADVIEDMNVAFRNLRESIDDLCLTIRSGVAISLESSLRLLAENVTEVHAQTVAAFLHQQSTKAS